MDKQALLNDMLVHRERWEGLIMQLRTDWLLEPGAVGGMSVKEILAHVAWYEQQCANMLEARALIGSDLWELQQDERNARVIEECRDCSLSEVRDQSRRAFDELLAVVESLSEDELQDVSHFKNWPRDWVPWKVIASDSFEHYAQHMPDIRAYLKKLRE